MSFGIHVHISKFLCCDHLAVIWSFGSIVHTRYIIYFKHIKVYISTYRCSEKFAIVQNMFNIFKKSFLQNNKKVSFCMPDPSASSATNNTYFAQDGYITDVKSFVLNCITKM